jgi:hypothetical protein
MGSSGEVSHGLPHMRIDLQKMLHDGIRGALADEQRQQDRGATNRARSQHFIEHLGSHLRGTLTGGDVRVLTRGNEANRRELGLNELLFDVLACRGTTTPATRSGRPLWHVTRGLWAIESEFSRDSRAAVVDFNKLVLADCDSKLFIGPRGDHENDLVATLAGPAAHCRGATYLALVPHPEGWTSSNFAASRLFVWQEGWQTFDGAVPHKA